MLVNRVYCHPLHIIVIFQEKICYLTSAQHNNSFLYIFYFEEISKWPAAVAKQAGDMNDEGVCDERSSELLVKAFGSFPFSLLLRLQLITIAIIYYYFVIMR